MNLFVISSFVIFVFFLFQKLSMLFFFFNLLDNEWRVCSLLRRKKVEGDSGVHSIGRCSCLAVGSCSKWKWTDRPPLRVAIPSMHTQQPAIQSRHVCYIVSTSRVFFCSTSLSAQRHFPSISLPVHMLNCWRNILFTMAAAIWWHCWHLFVCAKKKKKRVWALGFPWRMFDLGCEIKRWEYIQQRHNAEHFRTSRKKPNTTKKKFIPEMGNHTGESWMPQERKLRMTQPKPACQTLKK